MSEEVQVLQSEEVSSPVEAAVNTEDMIREALSQAKAEVQPEPEEKQEKPKGSDFIDVDDPAIKERINYLYKNAKASDETNKLLRQEHAKIAKALEVTLNKLDSIEQDKAKQQEDAAVTHLRAQIREARELGDDDRAEQLREMMVELKADQKQKQREAQREKEQHERQKQQNEPTGPIFNKDEIEYAEKLRQEVTEDGELLRPWMKEGDKDFKRAQRLFWSIAQEFADEGKQFTAIDIFNELDTTMTVRRPVADKPKAQQAVLSGKNTVIVPKQNISLSDKEKMVARKLGVTEKDYVKTKIMSERAGRISIDDF